MVSESTNYVDEKAEGMSQFMGSVLPDLEPLFHGGVGCSNVANLSMLRLLWLVLLLPLRAWCRRNLPPSGSVSSPRLCLGSDLILIASERTLYMDIFEITEGRLDCFLPSLLPFFLTM